MPQLDSLCFPILASVGQLVSWSSDNALMLVPRVARFGLYPWLAYSAPDIYYEIGGPFYIFLYDTG